MVQMAVTLELFGKILSSSYRTLRLDSEWYANYLRSTPEWLETDLGSSPGWLVSEKYRYKIANQWYENRLVPSNNWTGLEPWRAIARSTYTCPNQDSDWRLGSACKFIEVIAPWLVVLGPECHADRYTNNMGMTEFLVFSILRCKPSISKVLANERRYTCNSLVDMFLTRR